uniref:Uncharacterized protein TCIL3000_5_260 n=1 Tax=Trypanosoma congolense (strain IL3000) TaxID=1068625 RepID=G0UMD3_TRYCI|nr:unnamed protein product [Trypanosoma congolense IL3000]
MWWVVQGSPPCFSPPFFPSISFFFFLLYRLPLWLAHLSLSLIVMPWMQLIRLLGRTGRFPDAECHTNCLCSPGGRCYVTREMKASLYPAPAPGSLFPFSLLFYMDVMLAITIVSFCSLICTHLPLSVFPYLSPFCHRPSDFSLSVLLTNRSAPHSDTVICVGHSSHGYCSPIFCRSSTTLGGDTCIKRLHRTGGVSSLLLIY